MTSNLEVGTANLFVDTITGRVGIGKTDPSSALDINGNMSITGNINGYNPAFHGQILNNILNASRLKNMKMDTTK